MDTSRVPVISKHILRTLTTSLSVNPHSNPRGRPHQQNEETKAQRKVNTYLGSCSNSAAATCLCSWGSMFLGVYSEVLPASCAPSRLLTPSPAPGPDPEPPTPRPHQLQLTRHSVQQGVEQHHPRMVDHWADLRGGHQSQGL